MRWLLFDSMHSQAEAWERGKKEFLAEGSRSNTLLMSSINFIQMIIQHEWYVINHVSK
jgi:hypothetical protein